MKKLILTVIPFLLLSCVLSSCTVRTEGQNSDKDGLYIVCTAFPQFDFLRNIAGDAATVELLLPPGAETHTFGVKDLSPARLNELSKADLFIYIGGENDSTLVSELQTALPDSDIRYIPLISLVSSLLNQADLSGEEDHDHDHDEGLFDEHIWTSPKRAKEIVSALAEILASEDTEHGALFRSNAENYCAELDALDASLSALTSASSSKTLLFADRFPFRYLCHDYGLTAFAAFSGCSTAVEPSLSALDRLYKEAVGQNIKVILYVDGSDAIYAENLADKVGGSAELLHSCHNITEKEYKEESYLSLMQKNIQVLESALTQE